MGKRDLGCDREQRERVTKVSQRGFLRRYRPHSSAGKELSLGTTENVTEEGDLFRASVSRIA